MNVYRAKSRRSVQIDTSLSGTIRTESKRVIDELSSLSFEEKLKKICLSYSGDFNLKVKRDLHRTIDNNTTTRKLKPKRLPMFSGTIPTEEHDEADDVATVVTATSQLLEQEIEGFVTLNTVYDNLNRLSEIYMTEQKKLPRILLQVIQLLIPHYPQLANLTFRRCQLDKYTIYELAKIIHTAPITELCFDGSRLNEGNYALLLEKTSSLRVLSLARCSINDLVCELIAEKLTGGEPASNELLVLNLSSNMITDEGAKRFAVALRSNRALRHLNLAGNMITDDGAISIFASLISFPLTYEEYIGKRMRYCEHMRRLMEMTVSNLADPVETARAVESVKPVSSKDKKEKGKKPATTPTLVPPSSNSSNENIGPYTDPFDSRWTYLKDGYRYCIGNLILASLNLSYNNLGYPSLQKLLEVVKHQANIRSLNETGLLRPVLDGNDLPVEAVEYKVLADILGRYVAPGLLKKSDRKAVGKIGKGDSKP